MTIQERLRLAKSIKAVADQHHCELRDDQLDPDQLTRILALVEAAKDAVSRDRVTRELVAAMDALKQHGDI